MQHREEKHIPLALRGSGSSDKLDDVLRAVWENVEGAKLVKLFMGAWRTLRVSRMVATDSSSLRLT